ncbi:hypothetical protein XA68_18522 [Ophiocordyceps unilateralis]|uniref:Ribokinase n=1 Tax=Ophiocordyceps unilateralis TaxID=268505 RepID=A0A2A9PJ80_OPHUN|nr:hypothetical protein XA68_18522 [Ophiocordyceps unilateralis]
MSRRKRITVLGSLNADLIPYVSHHPLPGETTTATWLATGPGGKGANQAVACGRLSHKKADDDDDDHGHGDGDVEVVMVGAVGDDQDGRMLRHSLESSCVDTSRVRTTSSHRTGLAIVIVDQQAQNRIIVSPQANHLLCPRDVSSVAEHSQLLVLQLEIRLDTVLAAIASSPAPVLLNAAPAPTNPLPDQAYRRIAHLVVNESEAAVLAAVDDDDELQSETGLRRVAHGFLARGVKHVVITLGPRGVFYADSRRRCALVPAVKVDVVDTTAAGDTFVGAYALAVVRAGEDDFDIDSAVREANRAAAVTVSRKGAQTSIPWRSEIG